MSDDRPRRRYEDDDEDDRPRRRRGDGDEDDDRPRRRAPAATNTVAAVSLVLGILSFCLSVLAGIPAVVCGLMGMSRANRVGAGKGMAVAGLVLGLVGSGLTLIGGYFVYRGLKPAIDKGIETAQSGQDVNNLKQTGLAMHNYNDAMGGVPAAALTPDDLRTRYQIKTQGLPPLVSSWRLELLPFLNEDPLFRQFDRSKAWDDPRNKPVADTPIRAYWPSDQPNTVQTRFRVFTGPNTPFPKPGHRVQLQADFRDGLSNTFLVAESAELGPWAEPKDMPVTPESLPALGKPNADRFVVLTGDGSVRVVRKSIDPRVLRLLIDPRDGNVIPPGWEN